MSLPEQVRNEFMTMLAYVKKYRDVPYNDPTAMPIRAAFYEPPKCLENYIAKLMTLADKAETVGLAKLEQNEIGNLLESVAYAAFRGLAGASSVTNFTSATAQIDLLVKGDGQLWDLVCGWLFAKSPGSIVVECKATQEPVSDSQFARLCSLLDTNWAQTGFLGVFFSLKGATGFPEPGDDVAKRKIGQACLRQVIYHAKSDKSVIVFDKKDIAALLKPGMLLDLMIRKIQEIEELRGRDVGPVEILDPKSLPPHLRVVEAEITAATSSASNGGAGEA